MILDDAKKIVTGDRRKQYGRIRPNMDLIAKWWAEYLNTRIAEQTPERPFSMSGADVAAMMILLKIAVHTTGTGSRNIWVDIAGYAQLAAICAGEDEDVEPDNSPT
jgi:hypothetical protein